MLHLKEINKVGQSKNGHGHPGLLKKQEKIFIRVKSCVLFVKFQ